MVHKRDSDDKRFAVVMVIGSILFACLFVWLIVRVIT